MKIAFFSDIHDHVKNLDIALTWLHKNPVNELVLLGDLCSPFILRTIQSRFSHTIHLVFGNNDGDRFRLTAMAATNVYCYGEMKVLERGGKTIAINHFPDIAEPMIASGLYDVVAYGHNHQFRIEQINKTTVLNPGSLMGYLPGNDHFVPPTFAVYDTESGTAEGFEIDLHKQGMSAVHSKQYA